MIYTELSIRRIRMNMKNEAEQKFYNKKFIENFVEKTLAKAIFLFFFCTFKW